MRISPGSAPYYKRLMVFVDGTNLLVELSKEIEIEFRADKPPFSGLRLARDLTNFVSAGREHVKIRRFWFASYQGDEQYHRQLCTALRENDFEPVLFRKRGGKEKGVDIALTKEILVNAFNQNFDIALLVAGDADYIELIKEIKRYGPIVTGAFFLHGLSEDLRLAFDSFKNLEDFSHQIAPESIRQIKDEIGQL